MIMQHNDFDEPHIFPLVPPHQVIITTGNSMGLIHLETVGQSDLRPGSTHELEQEEAIWTGPGLHDQMHAGNKGGKGVAVVCIKQLTGAQEETSLRPVCVGCIPLP